nr:MAG TPA_asm: putative head-tail adaptor [Caudoviricetes sp.]
MIFDTQITLRLLSYPIVNGQTMEKLERETTVWAARKSVNRAEYYQAAQAGKRTDAIFRMHSAEYGGEQQLVCGSDDVFEIVRSYGQETEEVELTCKRRDGA